MKTQEGMQHTKSSAKTMTVLEKISNFNDLSFHSLYLNDVNLQQSLQGTFIL